MVFDIKTLILINFLVNFVNVFVAAIIWHQYKRRFPGLTWLLSCMIMEAAGICCILFNGIIPDIFSIILGNGMMLIGWVFLQIGLERFTGKPGPQIQNFIILVLFFINETYFLYIQPNLTIREVGMELVIVLIDLQICYLLWRRVSGNMQKVTQIIAIVMGIHLTFSILIFGLEILIPFKGNRFFLSGIIGEIIPTTYLVMGILVIIALIMMVTSRLLEEIRVQEEKFNTAFHSSPYAILITRASDGVIFEINDGFTAITGYQPDEVLGKTTVELSILEKPKDRTLLVTDVSKGKVRGVQVEIRAKSGKIISGLFSADIVTINSEQCILSSISDVTELKHTEQTLIQANRKLNLLSSITRHDILNRIMVVQFYGEELIVNLPEDSFQKEIKAITQSTSEIRTIIEFTGQYQELGSAAPEWQNIGLLFTIPEIQKFLAPLSFQSDLGSLEIYADLMLRKVVYNLVENSHRHGRNLTRITLSSHRDNDNLVIWYEDDGGGIPLDEKEKSFEKGYGKNTGLGLFLIREILSITGITIHETGDPGIGVRFEINIPEGKYRYTTTNTEHV
ncbi:PAS domain S-box protein [uncultured Methanospirillum sp.]|uniref:sensor histidine kinase n=1 Tax=uncultured Methanospirillum sp. TaxID=262503 RepID=UPI0029C8E0F3|nr:PAS domain S-box protein [uncultured Methanospirillum sp.]